MLIFFYSINFKPYIFMYLNIKIEINILLKRVIKRKIHILRNKALKTVQLLSFFRLFFRLLSILLSLMSLYSSLTNPKTFTVF